MLRGEKKSLEATAGACLAPETGFFVRGRPGYMATEGFYLAEPGDRLTLLDGRYRYGVATYSQTFPEKYLHTYDYAPEQIWGTYRKDLSEGAYTGEDYVFLEQGYFRVSLRRVDGESISFEEADKINEIIRFTSEARSRNPRIFHEEVERVTGKVASQTETGDLVLFLLTDTHAMVNGTWQDTAANLLAVQEKIAADGLVHLGDLTDGTVSGRLTRQYAEEMLEDLGRLKIPVHVVLGNHDANYFHDNPEVLSLHEQAAIYQQGAASHKQDRDKTYYYVDNPEHKLRLIFLSAYENNALPRYGFGVGQIEWLRDTLAGTAKDYQVLIFSHDAPLPELDPWSEEIRGGGMMMQVLKRSPVPILAYIHGHSHGDYIRQADEEISFPIISLGCAKCEDMAERKIKGSFTPFRQLGTATQELWDILLIKKSGKLYFIRFGAGHDRSV